jgi:hypothetical protein
MFRHVDRRRRRTKSQTARVEERCAVDDCAPAHLQKSSNARASGQIKAAHGTFEQQSMQLDVFRRRHVEQEATFLVERISLLS